MTDLALAGLRGGLPTRDHGSVSGFGVRPLEVRKKVTAVFADMAGSTALAETLDPELFRQVVGCSSSAWRRRSSATAGLSRTSLATR